MRLNARIWQSAWLLSGVLLAAPAHSGPAIPPTSTMTLEWTSPGDDGSLGTAYRYDLRYSLGRITPENFGLATPATQMPRPSKAGHREKVRVNGLEPNRTYYFALKTVDESGNWSPISNVTAQTAPSSDAEAVSLPTALSVPWPNPARVRTLFELSLPRETHVRIVVLDVSSRLVKTLALGDYPAGVTTFYWDLRDTWGRALPPGPYWIGTELGDRRVTRRLTVLP